MNFSVDTRNKENIDFVNSVYSLMMMVQIIPFLYERETGKMEWGESKRGRKRERDEWIMSVGDRVKVR